jgi:hypothetical protein
MMPCVFKTGGPITAIHGIPRGECGERACYAVEEEGVGAIVPCDVAGNGGYMTWFRVVYADDSDVIVSPYDIHEVIRDAYKEPK